MKKQLNEMLYGAKVDTIAKAKVYYTEYGQLNKKSLADELIEESTDK